MAWMHALHDSIDDYPHAVRPLLSIRIPGCVPVIAASVEIDRHEKVIGGAKEAVGQWYGRGLPKAQ